ncbi:MAG: hypothetical protein LAO08_03145 [Acidobacteriia bacterium]|nr:hypothetical protein [Terriglobia bacterium]
MQIQDSAKAILPRALHRVKKCFSYFVLRSGPASPILFSLIFIAATASAQTQASDARSAAPMPEPSMPDLPAQVAIPANKPIPVALDTTLSTVNAKRGQIVIFRTLYSTPLDAGLEIPPGTEILGHVVDVMRPAHFGREGELHLAVDRIRLEPDGGAILAARLDSDEMKGPGRFTNDAPHSSDLHPVAVDSAGGALAGAAGGGASGAAIGAGTGAALAVLILKSPRGQDVYLEQGMRFAVILDQPAYLSGAAVHAAQEKFGKQPRPSPPEPDAQNGGLPQLKRRQAPRP